jgi:hypothetical protein
MPLSWPLGLHEFWNTLPVQRISLRLGTAAPTSETGGGELISHARGARLWQGQVVLDKDHHRRWAEIEATLALLEQPGASFLLRDIRQQGLKEDPDMGLLGARLITIGSLAANNRELDLDGFAPGYKLSRGDLLGFSYGANPERMAFHRVVTGGAAQANGRIADVEVIPFLRPGAAVGAQVTLGTPLLKAKLPKAEYGAARAAISQGGTFDFIQTLR